MEVIEEIVPEPQGGAHRDYERQQQAIKEAVWRHLAGAFRVLGGYSLKQDRYEKFVKSASLHLNGQAP